MNDFINSSFPNGESYKDVKKRIQDFCEYLKTNFNEKHIAIVAHQAPRLALDVILKGKTWEQKTGEKRETGRLAGNMKFFKLNY